MCRYPILPPPTPKLPDMPINSIYAVHQLPRIKDESIDVDAIEPELNMEFKKNAPLLEWIIHEVYERPG